MKKKLIIFDLDGTLIDTLSDIEHIFNYVLLQNGLEKKTKNFYKILMEINFFKIVCYFINISQ